METRRHMAGHNNQALGPRMWCYKLPPRCSRRSFQLGRCSFHCRSICHWVQSSLDWWGYETGPCLFQHHTCWHISTSTIGYWREKCDIDTEELRVVGGGKQYVGGGPLTFNWEVKLWSSPGTGNRNLHKSPTSSTFLPTQQWLPLRISCSIRSMFLNPINKLIFILQEKRAGNVFVREVVTNMFVQNGITQKIKKPNPAQEKYSPN